MTPYYDEGGVTIYCGDNRRIAPMLGDFDLLLTSLRNSAGTVLEAISDDDYARALRLAAAQAGCENIVCYWGTLESATTGQTPTTGTSDAPVGSSWDGALTPGLVVDLGLNEEIASFCKTNYSVDFPLFSSPNSSVTRPTGTPPVGRSR